MIVLIRNEQVLTQTTSDEWSGTRSNEQGSDELRCTLSSWPLGSRSTEACGGNRNSGEFSWYQLRRLATK